MRKNEITEGAKLSDFHDFLPLIESSSIDLICTDPPYEINYQNLSWDGIPLDWVFLLREFSRILKVTGNLIIFQGWSNVYKLINLVETEDYGIFTLQNWIIWDRQKTKRGKDKNFTSAREDILWFTKTATKNYTFNKEDSYVKKKTKGHGSKNGSTFRRLSNVWIDVPPVMYTTKEYNAYPTQKPIMLMRRIIRILSNPRDTVLDCFCGSGTTLKAAKLEQRNYIGCDNNEEAIKITHNRLNSSKLF